MASQGRNKYFTYTIKNELQEPKFKESIHLEISDSKPLIRYIEQAVLEKPDEFKGFSAQFYHNPPGYLIFSINDVAGKWDPDKTSWELSNASGDLGVGVSEYIPKEGDCILFTFVKE